MEKLVVSAQDLERTPVFPTGGPVQQEGGCPVSIGARILVVTLGLVFPALCLATLIIWFVNRHKSPAIRYAWMQVCSLTLAISGLVSSLVALLLISAFADYGPVPASRGPTRDDYPLDSLTVFPSWPSEKTLTPKELAAALDSMVFIVARDGKWSHPTPEIVAISGFGSGALLFADEQEYLVATNRHVLDGEEWERGRPYAGGVVLGVRNGKFGQAQIVGRHRHLDLLLLRVERRRGKNQFAQPLQNFNRIETGERIVTFGHPQGLFFSLADGLVSRTDGRSIVQITAPVSPGSSGGPVFDLRGRLLGLVTSMWNKNAGVAENLNFATRSDALLRADDWNLDPVGARLLSKYIAAARAIPEPAAEP